MTKRIACVLLCLTLVLCLLSSCGTPRADHEADGVVVTDSVGREVTVPSDPVSISTICPFTGQMAILLGVGDRITSTVNNVGRSELIMEICPTIQDASIVKNSGSVNAEEILRLGTDLLFVNASTYADADERAKLDELGVPYVVIGYETIREQMQAVGIIGKALGKQQEAAAYIAYFQNVIDSLSNCRSSGSEKADPPRLYHAVNEAVRTDAFGSYCAEWIALTDAVNVSTNGTDLTVSGEKSYTTLEQIYAWDPDLIICNEPMVDDYILTDSKWQGLRAVTDGRVYQIPIGVTRWGHPNSVETPLAILWLSKLLYPQQFADLDIRETTRDFYQKFYDYTLDDAWLDAIMEADSMRKPKTEKGGEAA